MSNTISKQNLKAFFEIASANGWNVRNDYSGRCMYGDRCFAIDGDGSLGSFAGQLFIAVAEGDLDPYELSDMFETTRQDNMGLGMVYYFPGWKADDDEFKALCREYGCCEDEFEDEDDEDDEDEFDDEDDEDDEDEFDDEIERAAGGSLMDAIREDSKLDPLSADYEGDDEE